MGGQTICPRCGQANPPEFRFCGNCGNPLALPEAEVAERKVVTALFADLTASTELAARMDPEDLRGVLSPFFEAMASVVAEFGGTVEKFIGDAVVAVFGVPIAHEDDPVRAVRAALAMHARLEELNELLERERGVRLAMRIGVNTGEVVTATGVDREGLVTGEAVNIAARFQALATPGSVVVGERTHRDARRAFEFRSLGEVAVKGIDRPLPAWEAVRAWAMSRRAVFEGPLVGREDDLDLLQFLFSRTARERRASLATIVGVAGIGKTRLAEEFVARLERSGTRRVQGRCLPYGSGLTFWPLAEILKSDASVLETDDTETINRKTRAVVGARLGEGEGADSRILLASIGVEVKPDPFAHTDSDGAWELIAKAWRRYFEAMAGGEPLVVVIEDLHWADDSLLDLIEVLASRVEAPVQFLCLARPELSERRARWGGGLRNATTIVLSPLTSDEGERFLGSLLGEAAPPEVVRAVLDRAEGNPFFAGELLHMLIEDGTLVPTDGAWELVRRLPKALPDTVQGVIASRLDLLEPGEKRAIQDAAVVGREFWEGAVAHLGTPETGRQMDALIQKGLVAEQEASSISGERQLIFTHVLIREVAYRTIPRTRRKLAHGETGSWIEDHVGGRPDEYAEILAHHAERAEDHRRTARYAALAGRRKLRVFAADESIDWFQRALDAIERLDPEAADLRGGVLVDRGHAHEQLARFPDAEADFTAAVEVLGSSEDGRLRARALSSLAHVLWLQDRYDEGRRVLSAALDAARSEEARDLEAWLLYTAGTIAFGRGEWKDSLAFQNEALMIAEEIDDREGEALARHGLCETLLFSGTFDEALRHGRRSSSILRELEQWPMFHHNEYTMGWVLTAMGRLDEALGKLDEAIVGIQAVGDQRNEVHARAARAVARASRGDLGGALEDVETCLRMAHGIRSLRTSLIANIFAAEVAGELGDFEAVAEHARAARRMSDEIGGTQLRPRLLAFEAWCALRDGDHERGGRLMQEAEDAQEGALWETLDCDRVGVIAWGEAGYPEEVLPRAERLERLAAGESRSFLAWGLFGRSWAALLGPTPGDAIEPALSALEIAEEIGDVTLIWRSAEAAAEGHDDLGKHADAAPLRARAQDAIRRLADSLPDARRRQAFLDLPWIAPVLAR